MQQSRGEMCFQCRDLSTGSWLPIRSALWTKPGTPNVQPYLSHCTLGQGQDGLEKGREAAVVVRARSQGRRPRRLLLGANPPRPAAFCRARAVLAGGHPMTRYGAHWLRLPLGAFYVALGQICGARGADGKTRPERAPPLGEAFTKLPQRAASIRER
jgi:hypothetical protein